MACVLLQLWQHQIYTTGECQRRGKAFVFFLKTVHFIYSIILDQKSWGKRIIYTEKKNYLNHTKKKEAYGDKKKI